MDEEFVNQLVKMFEVGNKAMVEIAQDLTLTAKILKKKLEMPLVSNVNLNRWGTQVPWDDIVKGTGLASKPFKINP